MFRRSKTGTGHAEQVFIEQGIKTLNFDLIDVHEQLLYDTPFYDTAAYFLF